MTTRKIVFAFLLSGLSFPKLKCLEMGSAVVGADLIAAVESAFDTPVIEAYGLTEGGGPLREPSPKTGDHGPVPRGSCGIVAPEVEVKMIGADGAEHPSEGELWVRSPAVLSGYNNRPDLTAERIVDGTGPGHGPRGCGGGSQRGTGHH